MRDPKRIEEMLYVLRQIWELKPDLRLGQLLVNVIPLKEPCPEMFYIEDEKLKELLRTELNQGLTQN